jgi:hypothetical protein
MLQKMDTEILGMEGKCGFYVLWWLLKYITTNEIRTEERMNVLTVKLEIAERTGFKIYK